MISPFKPDDNLIAARLLDYFSTRTPWHRALWNAGTILALREVLEASEAQNLGHFSDTSIRGAIATALRLLKDDPDIETADERRATVEALTSMVNRAGNFSTTAWSMSKSKSYLNAPPSLPPALV